MVLNKINLFIYSWKVKNVKCFFRVSHFLSIIDTINSQHSLIYVKIQRRILFEKQILDQLRKSVRQELIKNVIVSLGWLLKRNARLFKQIGLYISASNRITCAKVNTDEFTKSRRVVVTCCFGVTVGFQHWVSWYDLILQTWFISVLLKNHLKLFSLIIIFSFNEAVLFVLWNINIILRY